MSRCYKKIVLTLGTLAILVPAIADARTIYADDDAPNDPGPGDPTVSDPAEDGSSEHPYDAIQEGIDAAVDGDELVVAPGTYVENVDFQYTQVLVRSQSPEDPGTVASTIIDGDGTGITVAMFGPGFSPWAAELNGFTVRNSGGPGIACGGGSPVVQNCMITSNGAEGIAGSSGDV